MKDNLGSLSPRQRVAVDAALAGANVFLSGPGGVGKSFTATAMIRALRAAGRTVAVCASTGIAAVSIGGMTIHSVLGLGIAANIDQAKRAMGPESVALAQKRLNGADVLVIDEVSMLTGDYIDMMNWWLRLVAELAPGDDTPFGGLQVVLIGDGLQLPPVVKSEDEDRLSRRYFFEADVWERAAFHECYLTESFRQEDAEMVRHLNRLRYGRTPEDTVAYFHGCVGRELDEPTRLVATNAEADTINRGRLAAHEGDVWSRDAQVDGHPKWCDALRKNCIADEHLELKVGVPVIIIKNDWERGYHNGQRGTVSSFEDGPEGYVSVLLQGGGEVACVPARWELADANRRVLASFTQMPLKLAWAMTVHKSQGMTLDPVQVSLAQVFERGQGYVAISRARRMEGLSLDVDVSAANIRSAAKVVAFYKGLAARQREREAGGSAGVQGEASSPG